jgi:O-antigen ligase
MLVTLAMWAIPAMRRHRRWITLAFLIQFLAQLTTGGRSSLIVFAVAILMLLILQRGSLRLGPLLVLLPIIMAATVGLLGSGFVERYSSVLNVEYVRGRNMPLLTGWLAESMKTDWVGLGAGYACVASRHVGATPLNVGVVENGLAKIRFEAGWPGLVFYVIFILSLMLYCLRQALAVRDIQTRWFSSACATFLIVNLASVVLGNPFDASPTNVYIWFFTGFLARAPMLGQSKAAEPAAGRG